MSVTSDRIKLLREKQDLTQAELGKLLNVSQRVVGDWETGAHKPNVDSLVDLCNALCTTPAFLLDFPTEDDLEPDEQELVSGYRKIDERGKKNVKTTLYGELKYYREIEDITGSESHAKTDIPTDIAFFISKRDPQFLEMKEVCKELVILQKKSGRSDLDVAKFMWSLGFHMFSAGTMFLIRSQLRVLSPLIAHLIGNYLTDNYVISFPDIQINKIENQPKE